MNPLEFSIVQMTRSNRDGSLATQANRQRGLVALAGELHELGLKLKTIQNLKPKHVTTLVDHWKRNTLADETIRNRLGWIRWAATRINKPGLIPADNASFGLAERTPYQGNYARKLDDATLAKVRSEQVRWALKLQAAFGLRREEALKFRVAFADKGDHLALKASWCKGGRARVIPLTHPRQRQLLDELRTFCRDGSLIPTGKSYVDQLQTYKAQTRAAGLGHAHGLRHAYAQWRYKTLSGRRCPAAGGPSASQLSETERRADRAIRLQISAELGHGRINVTDTYLGRRWQRQVAT